MKTFKKLLTNSLAVLLMLCMGMSITACDGDIKRGPSTTQPCTTYYGVAQTIGDSDGLFVYIPNIGVCDIPTYEKQITIEEGDVLIMEFYTKEVKIMERYPAEFAIPADSMVAVEFSFSLTWGIFGVSSYESATGRLVKTDDVSNKEDYETTHFLTAQEKAEIFKIIEDLSPHSYPDAYNPTEGKGSDPYQNIILSVEINGDRKTITAEQVALDEATSPQGKVFMDACKAIADILENTDEWKSLPDYPYLYD